MLSQIWAFLQDENNRTVLGWIGGGIAVVAGGLWGGLKFFFPKDKDKKQRAPTLSASQGGVVAGRDIRDSKIDTRGHSQR